MSAYAGNKNSKHNDTAQRGNVKFYENFNLQLMNGMRTMKLLFVTSEICGEWYSYNCIGKRERMTYQDIPSITSESVDDELL